MWWSIPIRRAFLPFFAVGLTAMLAGNASAQTPAPPTPSPALPLEAGGREAQLEERIRQLESMVNQLSTKVNGTSSVPTQVNGMSSAPTQGLDSSSVSARTTAPGATATTDTPSPGTVNSPSSSGGPSAPGQSIPPNPPASARFNSPPTLESKKGNVKFGPGFEFRTEDEEFILQFHNLTQFEYRGYQQGGQNPVRDTFDFPRQWFMFSGRISKPFGYFLSFANGFDAFSLLDVFVDYETDPRLKIRAGRMKTPFTYEFLVEPIQGLIIPERSLFFNNFGQNRDQGVMAYGRLFNKTVDYAAGIYNGARNGLISQNNSKHVSAFLNWKPFNNQTDSALENFNIGGSVYAGHGDNSPVPSTFRTNVATTGNAAFGVPFLSLNNNIREEGYQAFWDLHFAYFYRQLAVIGEWGSGYQGYAPIGKPTNRTYVPVNSYYVQAGYLLTGETRSSVGIVKPDRPFNRKDGEFGPGAWELTGRFNYLNLGKQVFTDGLANPNIWSNSVTMTDVGMNWHLTQYVKMYFDWEHAVFGEPVQFAPNRLQKTSDLFMVRLQLYF